MSRNKPATDQPHTASSSSLLQSGDSPLASEKRLAILSRTVFPSPEIHHVFPVQIRAPSYSDIALVGERHVEIKQLIHASGRLRHVATRADLDGRICAAAVLGEAFLQGDSDLDYNSSPLFEANPAWPPQTLVLALDTRRLVLLAMKRSARQDVFEFVDISITIPIQPASQSRPITGVDEPVEFLAVDPYGRALATASRYGTIFFCGCVSRTNSTVLTEDSLPLRRILQTDMVIAKLDFLFPTEREYNDQVYLIAVGDDGHRPALKIFNWRFGSDETPVDLNLPTPQEYIIGHGIPQVLIPLQRTPGGFVLICEDSVAMYTDVHLGRISHSFSTPVDELVADDGPQNFSGITRFRPLWKAWCRPHRRIVEAPFTHKETIYLVREDGFLCYFEVEGGNYANYRTSRVRELPALIERAFNHDGTSLEHPDGLVYGGSLSDGGVYGIRPFPSDTSARDRALQMRQTETLYNWAPFLDLVIQRSPPSTLYPQQSSVTRFNPLAGRILGTSGRAPYGGLSYLRYGYEAVIDHAITIVNVEDSASASSDEDDELGRPNSDFAATRVWAFRLSNGDEAALVSSPSESVFVMNAVEPTDTTSYAIPCGGETIVAQLVPMKNPGELGDLAIRVEKERLSVVSLNIRGPLIEEKTSVKVRGPLLAAGISSNCDVIVVVSQTHICTYFLNVSGDDGTIDLRAPRERDETIIQGIATCATVLLLDAPSETDFDTRKFVSSHSKTVAAISVSDGRVLFFELSHFTAPTLIGTWDLRSFSRSSTGIICDSLATIGGFRSHTVPALICGLRNGFVLVIKIEIEESGIQPGGSVFLPLGHSKVDVMAQHVNRPFALACCDGNAIRLDFSQSLINPTFTYIILTNPQDRAEEVTIDALCPIITDSGEHVSNSLVAFSRGKALFSRLSSDPKPLPLRLPLPGTPSRALYSETHRYFFVASSVIYTSGQERTVLSQIFLVHSEKVNSEHHYRLLYEGKASQRICWLMEWTLKHKGIKRTYLVATTCDESENGTTAGSIICFEFEKGTNTLHLKKTYYENSPVSAICQFDNETWIYCTGTKIKKRIFSAEAQRDRRVELARDDTPEAAGIGQYIVAHSPFISVTFSGESVKLYRLDGDRLQLVLTDSQARIGLSHVLLPEHNLLLATDTKSSIVGLRLWENMDNALSERNSFEATLPVSITRISHVDVRPPWKPRKALPSIERNLIGTAPNGSLLMFVILCEPTWRFLRFVQNLCERNKTICPFKDHRTSQRRHLEPANSAPTDFHIDGDVLSRLVDQADSAALLRDMLNTEPDPTAGYLDFDSATARERRFEALFSEMVDGDLGLNTMDLGADESTTVSRAIAIIAEIIDTPF